MVSPRPLIKPTTKKIQKRTITERIKRNIRMEAFFTAGIGREERLIQEGIIKPDTTSTATVLGFGPGGFTRAGVRRIVSRGGKLIPKVKPIVKQTRQLARTGVTKGTQLAKTGFTKTRAGLARTNVQFNKNIASRFLKGLGLAGIQTTIITKGAIKSAELTAKQEARDVVRSKDFDIAIRAGFKAESLKLSETGTPIPGTGKKVSLKGIANQLSLLFSSPAGNKAFRETVRERLTSSGQFTKAEVETGVREAVRQKGFRGVGEIGGQLNLARLSERVGRKEVAIKFGRLAKEGLKFPKKGAGVLVFKKTFSPIARAGVIEGSVQEVVREQARQEKFDPKATAIGAGLGGLTAGTLGGGIAGLRINAPGKSKALEFITNVADPFEKPGDILADITEFGIRKTTGRVTPRPGIVRTITPTDILSISPSETKKGRKKKEVLTGGRLAFQVATPTQVKTPTKILTFANILTEPKKPVRGGGKRPTPTPQPIPVLDPNTVVGTPPVVPNIVTPTTLPEQVNQPVPVTTNIGIFTNVPISTPLFRIPPPIPLILPFGLGAGRSRVGKKKVFVDELAFSKKVLSNVLGFGLQRKPKKMKKKKIGRKRKKQARKPQRNKNIFGYNLSF